MQNATLAGNAADSSSRPKQGTAGQRLSGNFMDIGLEPDGSVRSLSTRDNVTATLPATKDTPARTIRSTALTAAGNAQGLNQMTFTEGVEYREAATKTQGARIARAKSLEAKLDPGRGDAGGSALHRQLRFHRRADARAQQRRASTTSPPARWR